MSRSQERRAAIPSPLPFIWRVFLYKENFIIGEAASGPPAEVRFSDQFGTTHYVMVEHRARAPGADHQGPDARGCARGILPAGQAG
ncbi:OB-fold-containig protein [Microbulbifer sp. TB1203]|uniref:OB-fold-containig protein n=1 Tax=unclassified Microbulbifer TaxID=2619833 RepID=UPI0035B2BCCC